MAEDIIRNLIRPLVEQYFDYSHEEIVEEPHYLSFSNVIVRYPLGPFEEGDSFDALNFDIQDTGQVTTTALISRYIINPEGTSHYMTNPILTEIDSDEYQYEEISESDLENRDLFVVIDITQWFPIRFDVSLGFIGG
jgi:hypothetical protein